MIFLVVTCGLAPTGLAVPTEVTGLVSAARSSPPAPDARAGDLEDFTLRYALDRSAVPQLTYNALTLKIYVGNARMVSARADGKTISIAYSPQNGYVTATTTGSLLEIAVNGATVSAQTGAFTLAPLKDDRQWAWSHSFDDNVNFKTRGISAFEQYGWRGTVYLIGKEIDETRDEDWIIDKPDIISLVKQGWGIGNHSWSHAYVADLGGSASAGQDVIRLANYLRQIVDEAGRPDYHLISFAAPNFDSQYQPVILGLRNAHSTEILFNESGSDAILRVDPGAADSEYPGFDPDAPIGRDWRIDLYGSADDQGFRADLNEMLSHLDATHHYWLNTFTHAVDDRPSNQSIFAFLSWIDTTYGPQGSNTVWVAPAEEIYSYLLISKKVKISYTRIDGTTLEEFSSYLPLIKR